MPGQGPLIEPFRKGERLGASKLNRLARATGRVGGLAGSAYIDVVSGAGGSVISLALGRLQEWFARGVFLAQITDHEQFADGTYRWRYAWNGVAYKRSDASVISLDAPAGTLVSTGDWAINIAELVHDSTGIVWGVNIDGADYPAGFSPKAVGGGGAGATHQQDVIVQMHVSLGSDGNPFYWFDRMGTHDGTCAAP